MNRWNEETLDAGIRDEGPPTRAGFGNSEARRLPWWKTKA